MEFITLFSLADLLSPIMLFQPEITSIVNLSEGSSWALEALVSYIILPPGNNQYPWYKIKKGGFKDLLPIADPDCAPLGVTLHTRSWTVNLLNIWMQKLACSSVSSNNESLYLTTFSCMVNRVFCLKTNAKNCHKG